MGEPRIIKEEDIEEYIHNKLIKHGLVPSESEIEIVAHIFFDYMVDLGVIVEE
jgi:hypothetical protein